MARKKVEEDYEEAKQRFIDAAINELMESGYSKFTLTSVAKKAGVTKAALYWYFPSKENLIEEIVNNVYNFNVKKLQLIAVSSAAPIEKLRAIFVPPQDSGSVKMCILPVKIFMELLSETNELKRKIQQGYETYISWVAKIVQEGIEAGDFQSHWSSWALSKYIVSTFDGASIQGLILTQNTSDFYEMLFEMAMAVLRKQ